MLERLGKLAIRQRKVILISMVILAGVCATVGSQVVSKLSTKGFDAPNSEAVKSDQLLHAKFGSLQENVILVFNLRNGKTVGVQNADGTYTDNPAVKAEVTKIMDGLKSIPRYIDGYSYYTLTSDTDRASFRCCNDKRALAFAIIDDDDQVVVDHVNAVIAANKGPDISVELGGEAPLQPEFTSTVEKDLKNAEMIAFPLTLLLLLFVFRSVVAAVLPLLIGSLAIVGTLFILWVLSKFTTVSIFSLNLTTMLGLGLAIDYSLFVVSRFREELAAGKTVEESVITSVCTAGRTVTFSGIAVGVSLAALVIFPQPFLKSFAYAGIAVAAVALLGALFVLPAMLATLGHSIDRFSVRKSAIKPIGTGGWARLARFVMKFAWPLAISVSLLLVAMALPLNHVHFGLGDENGLPKDSPGRVAMEHFHKFLAGNQMAVDVIFPNVGTSSIADSALESKITAYKDQLFKIPAVQAVVTPWHVYSFGTADDGSPSYLANNALRVQVVGLGNPLGYEAEKLVRDVRAVPAPFPNYVGGQSAKLVDNKAILKTRIIIAAAFVGVVTFLMLMVMFGSILVPLKAVVLSALSLCAMFGAVVWLFQDGKFGAQSWLGFTSNGIIEYNNPIVMFCVAFGLSMDYEVFLLSRIREEYERSHNNQQAVAYGIEKTGRIITAAALLLALVFVAFATSRVSFIKMVGVGLTLAILLDATLIRGILVPSFMRLAGRANWWAPKPVKKLASTFGWRE